MIQFLCEENGKSPIPDRSEIGIKYAVYMDYKNIASGVSSEIKFTVHDIGYRYISVAFQ
jgi:hypothetical protein